MSDPRLGKLAPAELDPDQRAVYDAVVGGRRGQGPQLFRLVDEQGRLEGPFNAFLLQPALGAALQALGSAVRYQGELSDRAREIAILVVSGHHDSVFEQYAHEAVGRHAGLTDDDLLALRRRQYDGFAGTEAVVARAAEELARTGDLSDATYPETVDALGVAGVFELTTLVGYYSTLAVQLRVFRVPLPGDGPA